jgi:hypothetical protein
MALTYQIACIILTALFFLSFSVAREPRGWRRLFQSSFSNGADFSVNKNKVIDESLKKYGIGVAMTLLVLDVGLFVWGLTEHQRTALQNLSPEEASRADEYKKRIGDRQGAVGAQKSLQSQ